MDNHKHIHTLNKHGLIASALLAAAGMAASAPMDFSQTPPGAGAREPAPNVIVSVDDSGSMEASGMATLRQALLDTFGTNSRLADDRIRLAWQSMNRCPSLGTSSTACGNYNGMRYLGGTHRSNFHNWASTLTHSGGTPGHLMIANAGDYLMGNIGTNVNSPWAANPGTALNPILSCRKNYHIFMTDGGWNSGTSNTTQHIDTSATNNGTRIFRGGGNADGTTKTLPDNRSYDVTSNQTRLYRDDWGRSTGNTRLSTLADLTFHYWSTDLQSSLENNVRPTMPQRTSETFTASNNNSTTLDPYWNPRNNPATWQNLVTYTIGFNSAATWTGGPAWGGDTFSGGLANLINGTSNWTSPFCGANNTGTGNNPCDGNTGYTNSQTDSRGNGRKMDLWHAALNGRGRFVPAQSSQDLVDAFQYILDDILAQTSNPIVSITNNTSRLSTDGLAYIANFNSERWSGDIAAHRINARTGLPATHSTWKVSDHLDGDTFSHTDRVVLTHNGTNGVGFKWANLATDQRNLITGNGADTDTVGQARIDYLRGDRSLERNRTGGYMRQRDSVLGDITNSNLWHTGKPVRLETNYSGHASFRSNHASRTPMLYVGANDGMLHGFNARTGRELLAYVPRGVYANLRNYTLPDYTHRYYVDGSPFTGDADLGGSLGWRTVLVGTLAGGGKGYFVLDVTNPANFNDPGTGTTSPLVLLDETAPEDDDVGHIFAPSTVDNQTATQSQQIVKLNDDRWALIMGNGYNSTNERPVLLIQYLDGARELKKLVAHSTTGQTNGLGAPAVYDIDGNGTVDVAYAGDLRGNLWKFNLVSTNDSDWGVSAWNGAGSTCSGTGCVPLFVAKDASGNTRPITAAPFLMVHPLGGLQVIFGTGKDLIATDRNGAQGRDTLFSVWDLSTYSINSSNRLVANETGAITSSNGRSRLVQQTQTGTTSSDLGITSANAVEYSRTNASARRGWYFDLPVSGERLLLAPRFFDGQTVMFNSVAPRAFFEGETCDISNVRDVGYLTFLNGISGAPPKTSVFGDVLDPSGNATRVQFGTGDISTINDLKNNKTIAIDPNQAVCSNGLGNCEESCEGEECSDDDPDNPRGPTTCVGPDCSCNGQICTCLGASCECQGPNCRTTVGCGGLTSGVLDACRSGLFGARTDWRELR